MVEGHTKESFRGLPLFWSGDIPAPSRRCREKMTPRPHIPGEGSSSAGNPALVGGMLEPSRRAKIPASIPTCAVSAEAGRRMNWLTLAQNLTFQRGSTTEVSTHWAASLRLHDSGLSSSSQAPQAPTDAQCHPASRPSRFADLYIYSL